MLLPHAASWIPGNASPICLSGQAETLAFGTELPVTQSRTALLLSRVVSRCHLTPPLHSPGGRGGLSSSCASILTQTRSPHSPHPPGPILVPRQGCLDDCTVVDLEQSGVVPLLLLLGC